MTAAVSRETLFTDPTLYEQLITWAVWATDRRDVPRRHDPIAGDFRMSDRLVRAIQEVRHHRFPVHIEAIEKAVASLRTEHDEVMLYAMVDRYFLRWRTIEQIATDEDLSEFHVVEYLQRAIRLIGQRLPTLERQVAAAGKRGCHG